MNRDQLNAAIREEFPDYDTDIEPVKGFANTSWHNDACPSLSINVGEYEARIWLDYASPDLREFRGPDDTQYLLYVMDGDNGSIFDEPHHVIPADAAERMLSVIYKHWCKAQGLPAMSADELLFENVTDDQAAWLERFMDIWMAAV